MSWIFEHNNVEIWSPSLNVGKMFLSQVKHLEDFAEMSSGVIERISMPDMVEINFDELNQFMLSIANFVTSENEALRMFVNGCVIYLLAFLLWDTDSHIEVFTLYPDEWVQKAHEVCRLQLCHE